MKEKTKNYCPDCGAEMIEFYEKPSFALECPKCGYGIATTRWEDIDLDTTDYKIIVKSTVNPLISQIKTVSKITGYNFIESKRILENGDVIFEGIAINIKLIIKKLCESEIQYVINPDFPY